MTQEQKDLLLKYLCMALPYGVKVQYSTSGGGIRNGTLTSVVSINDKYQFDIDYCFCRDNVKPYLRPMSSMTEEEMEELEAVSAADIVNPIGIEYYGLHTESFAMEYEYFGDITGWLLANHFDFMKLIPMDSAIEVTKENNPYKERG